jgi:hypothetical protein
MWWTDPCFVGRNRDISHTLTSLHDLDHTSTGRHISQANRLILWARQDFFNADTCLQVTFFYITQYTRIGWIPYCCFTSPTGSGDNTICFHCVGGLRDWEEDDDHWFEHGAWFPYCVYVTYVKGPAFIRQCRRLRPLRQRQMEDPYSCNVL